MAKFKVVILDPLAEEGIKILQADPDLIVDIKKKPTPEEIKSFIGDYDAAVVRSESKLTAEVIELGKKLKVVGRAGVGLDNIDVVAATKHGVIVTNTPDANTLSTAELTMSLMLGLSRNIAQADASLKQGKWERSKFVGVELYDKTLGIVGLGRIGKEVAKRARAFGMKVMGYDPYVPEDQAKKLEIEKVTLQELTKRADYITVHVPLVKETSHLFGAAEMAQMKKGVRLINCARGGIYEEKALYDALVSGQVAGAALDVFEKEPPAFDNPLFKLPNVLTTQHLGASTEEAQLKVAKDMANQIIQALKGGPGLRAVNMPNIDPTVLKDIQPYLHLVEKLGRFIAQMAAGSITELKITYIGAVASYDLTPLTISAIKGILEVQLKEGVNFVNAHVLAKERGLNVVEAKSTQGGDFSSLITLEVQSSEGHHAVAGTLFRKQDAHFVKIDGYDIDVEPTNYMLLFSHLDKPGIVGHLGTVLGAKGINIAGLYIGREKIGGRAIAVVTVDTEVPDQVLSELTEHDNIERVKLIRM